MTTTTMEIPAASSFAFAAPTRNPSATPPSLFSHKKGTAASQEEEQKIASATDTILSTTSSSTNTFASQDENVSSSCTTNSERYVKQAVEMATQFGFTEFEALLTTGGDDRSLILPDTGANKYHIQPVPILPSQIFRGSCTGNPPTRTGYDAAKKLYEEKLQNLQANDVEQVLRDIFEDQRQRLANYLGLLPGSEIILCPSGSDAEYIPVAIARALTDKPIVNGVTQLNEIGAGTAPASVGKYFSKYAPFLGDHGLEYLAGYEGIEGFLVDAREADGSVTNAAEMMKEFSKQQIASGKYPIVHGVFGGKTGVRDAVMPASLEQGDVSLGIVDACQGRFTRMELQQWLEQDSLVLFTTSKFYQAPPFCGAVILPSSIAKKLSKASPPKDMLVEKGLLAFLTDKELPECMASWKPLMKVKGLNNIGLALRWEAGLASMERISFLSDDERTALTNEWAAAVQNMIDSNPFLQTFCVERSIISIRIKMVNQENETTAADTTSWLGMKDARDVFRWMSLDVSTAVPEASAEERQALATSAFIGQPVSVSQDFAIVRIALGADSLLSYFKDKTGTLQEDQSIVNKLGAISKYFETIRKSGL